MNNRVVVRFGRGIPFVLPVIDDMDLDVGDTRPSRPSRGRTWLFDGSMPHGMCAHGTSLFSPVGSLMDRMRSLRLELKNEKPICVKVRACSDCRFKHF